MTERVKNGTIVREADRLRGRELSRVLLFCFLLAVPVFFYVWQQVTLYQMGQQIQQMERKKAKLVEEGRRLDLQRAELTALGRVESIAREELGFVDGAPVEMLALGEGGLRQLRPKEMVARADAAPRPGPAAVR
ncbi:MAG: cell division protein FtsL [Acidobacteriota bacterium]